MRCKAIFDTGAPDKARAGFALAQKAEGLPGQFAETEPGGSVDQDIIEGDAGTAAYCAVPRICELKWGRRIPRAGDVEISLATDNELAELPIVAGFDAALESVRAGRVIAH